ncbi:hypothetical protein HIM_00170 [Hirsutella minnesotensis 3608]|nr:hypothetical protein HIM_00170 [Hirsutella minnesotensis 3608]
MNRLFGRAKRRLAGGLCSASNDDSFARMDKKEKQAAPPSAAETPKDGPPPAYTPSAASAGVPPASAYNRTNLLGGEDPYHFLYFFDTVFLIDDSSSMVGGRWRDVMTALGQIMPVCTSHDDDGVDVYFMNNLEHGRPAPRGKAPTGYYGLTDMRAVHDLFRRVRPRGPTPTRRRLEAILDPYFAQLDAAESPEDVKPINLIVLTDGMPGPRGLDGTNPHLPEDAIVSYARRLDALGAPAYQVGIQFIQVGDDDGATQALRSLDKLQRKHKIRDIVDTTHFTGELSGDGILKAVLGGVDKRLDDDTSSSEGSRRR